MNPKATLFPSQVYCIDTSALINLMPPYNRDVYRKDVFPTIWLNLEDMIKSGELMSPLQVLDELKDKRDAICDWCLKNKKMFKDIDECQIAKIEEVKKKYDSAFWKQESNRRVWADPWVIALAICEKAIIVADEKNVANRIPYIAGNFSLKCLGLVDFFKEIGIKC